MQMAAGSGGGMAENPGMLALVSVRHFRACSMPSFSTNLLVLIDSLQPCELRGLTFAVTLKQHCCERLPA